MEFKEIQDLIKLVNKSSLTEVEIERDDFKLRIKREQPESQVVYTTPPAIAAVPAPPVPATPAVSSLPLAAQEPVAAPPKEEDTSHLYEFKSPMIGTFYRSASPENPPFSKVGDEVQQGDVLCIVEAMKLFNELESEVSGKIVKIMVENAQPIEYDQVLFLIDTNV